MNLRASFCTINNLIMNTQVLKALTTETHRLCNFTYFTIWRCAEVNDKGTVTTVGYVSSLLKLRAISTF